MNAAALQEARREQLAATERAEQARAQAKAEAATRTDAGEDADPASSHSDVEEGDSEEAEDDYLTEEEEVTSESESEDDRPVFLPEEDTEDGRDPRARVLSVLELEDLFKRTAPDLSSKHPLCTFRRS